MKLPDNFKVKITQEQIKQHVCDLGKKITDDYKNSQRLIVICLANGGCYFGVDLTREIKIPIMVGFFGISSYVNNRKTNKLEITTDSKIDVRNFDVLLVDDVLDTGETLHYVKQIFLDKGAQSVKTAVFIQKKIQRTNLKEADYYCCEFENEYAIGYGLDDNELYRNLYLIGIKQEGDNND